MIFPCCCGGYCQPLAPVDKWENVTKVVGRIRSGGDNPDENPYARPWNCIGGGACDDAESIYCTGTSQYCGGIDSPKCAHQDFDASHIGIGAPDLLPTYVPWPKKIHCSAGPGETVAWAIDNCYRKNGTTTVARNCIGWKGVVALAVWPGIRFPFLDCCDTGGQNQSKYSAVSVYSHGKHWRTGYSAGSGITGVEQHDYTWQQTAAVDSYGNVRRSGSKSSHWKVDPYSGDVGEEYDNCDGLKFTQYDGTADVEVTYATLYAGPGTGGNVTVPGHQALTVNCDGTISWGGHTGTVAEMNALNLYPPIPSGGNAYVTITGSGTPATFTVSGGKASVKFSGSYRGEYVDGSYWEEIQYEYEYTIQYAGSITWASVLADAKTLLNEWRLQDDAQYPWRIDGLTWQLPFVTRDAAATEPTIQWNNVDGTCHFQNEVLYTGQIIGKPLPAGYDPYYNFRHINWELAGSGYSYNGCATSIGASSPCTSATQWTNRRFGGALFGPGAHVMQILTGDYGSAYAQEIIDGVVMQKWAETLEAWPSINYSRPCAADRLVLDPARASCGDTAKKWSPKPRAICGKLKVVAATQAGGPGTAVTITVNKKHYLESDGSDHVDFNFGTTTELTPIGGNIAATATGDYTFTVPYAGTLATYSGGGYVRSYLASPGTPDPRDHCDTCPEHRYIKREWQSQHRAQYLDAMLPYYVGGGTQSLEAAIEPSAVHPTVLYCSPNAADVFEHGRSYTFGTITADLCMGEEWHLDFVQTMNDPFWSGDDVCCSQQDYPCAGGTDGTRGDCAKYPYPPQVEPAITLPAGKPALAAGVSLWSSSIPAPENISFPSIDTHIPNSRFTVHNWRAEWLACNDWKEPTGHTCASFRP